jgi:ATP-dependent exoDNAse (exonuclease V) beta subunit
MAKVYRNIGNVLGSIGDRERAIESFSKGLEVLEELQEKTGYHHALIDSIQQRISQITREKSKGKLR